MFASPLVRYRYSFADQSTSADSIQQLNWSSEFNGIITKLNDLGVETKVRCAQSDTLPQALLDNPIGLHFSGHGYPNTPQEVGDLRPHVSRGREGQSCLVFETEDGEAQFITEDQLRD